MKLSDWAKKEGLTYGTAYRLFRQGKLPARSKQLETGTILVYEDNPQQPQKTFVYTRVSSYNKKEDLLRQRQRCLDFCLAKGWPVDKIYSEVASGVNDKRKQLSAMFEAGPANLVVEHKDRLTRFGFNYIEILLTKLGWNVAVINRDEEEEEEERDDLMKDLISIITSFCCRLYGLRKGRTKAKQVRDECLGPVK